MIYANNAGTSWPKPPEVSESVQAALVADPREHDRLLESARAGISRFLGIRDPGELTLTPGCTSALSVVIEDLPWKEGDIVLTSSLEHHALIRPIERLARRIGVVHETVPYRPGVPADPEAVRAALRSGKIRLVAMTAASNVTGEILPIEEITAAAHERGALCLVDAAQTAGVIPLDVDRLGADILVLAGHKGPLGPQGVGCLWTAPGIEFETPSASCDIATKAQSCRPRPGACDVGSTNLAGTAGLAAGMRWHEERGIGSLGRSSRALAKRLAVSLADRRWVTVWGAPDSERTATVSFTIEGLPIEQAEDRFRAHGVILRAAEHCAPMALQAVGAPGGTIRISFGPFNGVDDIEPILEAVDAASGR